MRYFSSLFFCAMLATTTCGAWANSAPATQKSPITEHEYRLATLDYNQRTMPQAYEQAGSRNPKWDAEAIRFLQAMALHFSDGGVDKIYELPGDKSPPELLAMGKAARDKGCDDPMVAYCYAALLSDMHDADEARPLFEQAGKALMSSHYPVTRATYAAAREFRTARGQQARDAAWIKFRDLIVTTLSTWDFKNLDRRIIFQHLKDFLTGVPTSRLEDLVDSAHAVPTVDPWVRDVLEGYTEIQAAWDARGNGLADSVTQQGWQGFYTHLAKARDALTAAWKRHPDYPEAASLMITVGMGAGEEFNESPRKWFDRAVAAQIDYFPAYIAYRNAILPRWGGSIGQMQSFANESLASKRFDTLVPWQYVVTVESIVHDSGDPAYWKTPGVYEATHQICQGYIKTLPAGPERDFYSGFEAAAAWRVGKYSDATKMLDALEGDPPIAAFARFGVMPKLAMSHAYAMANPASAKAIATGEQQAAAKQLDQAIATYTGAVKAAGNKPSGHYLRCRLQQLQWWKQFDKGDWVDIKPSTDELIGWEAEAGTWKVESDGTLTASPGRFGPMLTFQGLFMPPRYEVEMTFQLPQARGPVGAGFSLVPDDPASFRGWTIIKEGGSGTLTCGYTTAEWNRAMNVNPGDNTLLLRHWDDKVKVDFDDQSYPRFRGMDQVLRGPKVYLAIGGTVPPGKPLRISKIRLRKLTQEPPKE